MMVLLWMLSGLLGVSKTAILTWLRLISVLWRRRLAGFFRGMAGSTAIRMDDACVDGENRTACGGVFRDCSGHWVKGLTRYLGTGICGFELSLGDGHPEVVDQKRFPNGRQLITGGCVPTHLFHSIINRIRQL